MSYPISRRTLIKSGITGTLGLAATSLSSSLLAQSTRGIKNQRAPELNIPYWIDGQGKEREPFNIAEHRGKWVYLKCFQEWCPACHSVGFPNLQKLVTAFPTNEHVVSAVIQTTFEGHSINTVDALRKNQLRYDLDLPFAHDPGDTQLPNHDPGHYPLTMASYRTGGTPWVVIINPLGTVVFNDFHVNIDKFIQFLKQQTA